MTLPDWQQRTVLLTGKEKSDRYRSSHVIIAGAGGVGAYAAEMLCRAGIGKITIIDSDTVQPTNINRQLIALHSTVARKKTDVLSQRLLDINPDLLIEPKDLYITEDNIAGLLDASPDFVIDAIDTIAPKCALITECLRRHIKIISSMGAGAKKRHNQDSIRRYKRHIQLRTEQSNKAQAAQSRRQGETARSILIGTGRQKRHAACQRTQ